MLLADLVRTWQEVGATRSRRAKVALLAACLRRLAPEERAAGASFLAGHPPLGRLGVGWAALAEAKVPPRPEPSTLTVAEVDSLLSTIAAAAGPGSRRERARLLGDLLGGATVNEQRFLQSLIMQDLRQGALEGLLVEALAAAAGVPLDEVRRAVMVQGELGPVAAAALGAGAPALRRFALGLFRPLLPMLAQTADGLEEAVGALGLAVLEAKIDGARIQVHRQGERVAIFTRTGRDVTPALPEVAAAALALPVRAVILDGEAVALLPGGRPLPFQVTMSRFGSAGERPGAETRLTPLFFDCLHLDGEDLLDRPTEARAAALAGVVPGDFLVARTVTASAAEAAAFYERVLAMGHEGLLVKDPAAAYEAGRRGAAWLKVKPFHTVDLVVLAAEWGSGRRRGFLSNLHLGARDPDSGSFVMLGKTFKGLTDEMLAWQTAALLEREVERRGHVVAVRPELVVEIACDGVQASPRYPGGVTLRFARVKRYRPDKSAVAADTITTVRSLQRA